MKRYLLLGVALLGVSACIDLFGPGRHRVSLSVVPVFDEFAAATVAVNADVLHVIVQKDSLGTFNTVADTTVDIDPVTGEASVDISVFVVESPQLFRILFEVKRLLDDAVLYAGVDTVSVTAGDAGDARTQAAVEVSYVGPEGESIVWGPLDTAMQIGDSLDYRVSVFDSDGAQLAVPWTVNLLLPRDSNQVTLGRLTGRAVSKPDGSPGRVDVFVETGGGLKDTTSLFLVLEGDPVFLELNPGYLTIGIGSTFQLTAALLDASDLPVPGEITYTSRTPSVASVTTDGLVTGLSRGISTVLATSAQGFTDSLMVTVGAENDVVVWTLAQREASRRSFRTTEVGGQIVIDVLVDVSLTNELVGSYNATMTWNSTVLSFVGVEAGDFPLPELNDGKAAQGELRFAQINVNGASGEVVLARIRFDAVNPGTTQAAVAISEMTAAITFTNLLAKVTVTNGTVTLN